MHMNLNPLATAALVMIGIADADLPLELYLLITNHAADLELDQTVLETGLLS